jgi:plasmid stabilization system protein ParE
MTVHWTETALGHLRAIRDYVARNSPGYAQALADRITRRTEKLASMPFFGAEVPEYADESIREVLEHPYRIIYRVSADRVEILAVLHGARRLPTNPPG